MAWTRRNALLNGLALGCSAAASPLVTPVSLAAAPWDARLVVIILRGGMDGLDVLRPLGDPDFAALRPGFGGNDPEPLDLDGFFALHGALEGLMPLWRAGELGFAHAVSTPYRDKRSHFDGQDLLEAGAGFDARVEGGAPVRDGWLNRMLQQVPGVTGETAFAVGRADLRVLAGPAPVANWAPETRLELSPQAEQLLELVAQDHPLYQAAIAEALELTKALEGAEDSGPRRNGAQRVADFAAARLRAETRVAAFSLNGWDTHRGQPGALSRALGGLSDAILALRDGLGPVWGRTTVLAMTEFGRTARINGTNGTDHGTGGAMLLAGGTLRGGQVWGRWPGLAEADLYDRRDLMPTADVRAYVAAVMRDGFGLDRALLERTVFPGLDMDGVERVLL